MTEPVRENAQAQARPNQARERSTGRNVLERRGLIRTQFQVILGGLSARGLDQRRFLATGANVEKSNA